MAESRPPEADRGGTHLIGFALFGFAWPAFVVSGKILLWIVTAFLIAALAIVDACRWARARLSVR